jgi:uncharacterized membrane protein (DUF373 family)
MRDGSASERKRRRRDRRGSAGVGQLEQVLYLAVALALGITGVALLVHAAYAFAADLLEGAAFMDATLRLLDALLLVFIIAELLHTVRAAVSESVLLLEPFLIVGIIASIRRLILITAEASSVSEDRFRNLMLELGILAAVSLALGGVLFLIRHTQHHEPRPSHEDALAAPTGSNASSPTGNGDGTESAHPSVPPGR